MKKVREFIEGDHIETKLLVSSAVRGVTNAGLPYLSLILQDNTKQIDAKLWELTSELEKLIEPGKVYFFSLEINNYRGSLQAKIVKVMPVDSNEINLADFALASPYSKEELSNFINQTVNNIKNENIAKIVTAVLNECGKDFYDYPAASKIHHNYIGGLATHTVGMIKIGEALCDIYSSLNRDYLIAGIILHDIGKIDEFSSSLVAEYSTSGKLLGHISIMDAKVYEISKKMKLEDTEELLILRHLILSHHGEFEFGSPIRPATIEAEILHFIDNIDSKINILEKALNDVETGKFTSKIFALDNRIFYKHK